MLYIGPLSSSSAQHYIPSLDQFLVEFHAHTAYFKQLRSAQLLICLEAHDTCFKYITVTYLHNLCNLFLLEIV